MATAPRKPLKPKRCRACKDEFNPRNSMQVVCFSPECAQAYAQGKRLTAERKEVRKKLAAIKPRSQWMKEAQSAFNAYIRERDAEVGCVSCGRNHQGQWHAGHYLSTGARPELRFDEDNVHKQCQPCNTHLHGNVVLYRLALLDRIGDARLARLEGRHSPAKYDIPSLKLIITTYRAKTKALKAQREDERMIAK